MDLGALIAETRADSARSVSLGCVADKAYPDGCTYHYWESEGRFCETPRTDQHVLPLWTVALPCFRPHWAFYGLAEKKKALA